MFTFQDILTLRALNRESKLSCTILIAPLYHFNSNAIDKYPFALPRHYFYHYICGNLKVKGVRIARVS